MYKRQVFSGLLQTSVFAQQRQPLDALFLPEHTPRILKHGKNQSWVMLSKKPLDANLNYYLKLCTPQQEKPAQWLLTYPDLRTASAWVNALYTPTSDKKLANAPKANFILNLHHKQTGLNFNLTLGEVTLTTHPLIRSIITVYAVPERKEGTSHGLNGSLKKKNQKPKRNGRS